MYTSINDAFYAGHTDTEGFESLQGLLDEKALELSYMCFAKKKPIRFSVFSGLPNFLLEIFFFG